jgi:hypothetical protein
MPLVATFPDLFHAFQALRFILMTEMDQDVWSVMLRFRRQAAKMLALMYRKLFIYHHKRTMDTVMYRRKLNG